MWRLAPYYIRGDYLLYPPKEKQKRKKRNVPFIYAVGIDNTN